MRCNLESPPAGGSRDGYVGMGDILYISDGDPNLLNANRNDDGQWLNANYDNPDNRWNRSNGFAFAASQLTSFSLLLCGRVFFSELSSPSSKISTNLFYSLRN